MRIIIVAILVVFTSTGQDLRSELRGRITDPDGAAVPAASVSVTSMDTGVRYLNRGTPSGDYYVESLPSGLYTVQVTAAGFKQAVREQVVLALGEHKTLDIELQIGDVSESIIVVDDPRVLSAYEPVRGSVLDRQPIIDLPNNGRNLFQFVWAAAGVTKASTYWGSLENYALGNATNVYINGGVRRENETVLDGITNTAANRDVLFQPPLEATEELRVQVSNYDAAYGRFGGGVVAISTKSGTNTFHGILFETHKNASLSANSWRLNSLGQPRSHFINNTFGFQVGGPVLLPKAFDGRNRLFFMVAHEGLRERSSSNLFALVPTVPQRSGDFSAQPQTIYDPLSTRVENGRFVRSPFLGNRIPAGRLDPVAQAVIGYVPRPNLDGQSFPQPNFSSGGGKKNGYNQWLTRLDASLNAANRLYFTFGQLPYEEYSGVVFGANSPADPSNSNPLLRDFSRWAVDWGNVASPSLSFNLRAGLTRYVNTRWNAAASGFDPRKLGFSDTFVSQMGFLQFPLFNLGGGYSNVGVGDVFSQDARDTWSLQPSVVHSAGAHLLHTGAEFRLYNENTRTPGSASGQFIFAKGYTQADPSRADAQSGDELASLLLGYPASGRIDRNIDPAFQSHYWAAFLQDTWRVNSRLTVTLGLRYDYERPYAERYNRMLQGFDLSAPSPLQVPALNLRGQTLFATSQNRLAFLPDRNNMQPRISAAYRVLPSWIVRAGYGLFYLGVNGSQPTTGFSQSTALVSSVDGGNTPRVSLTNPFPEGLLTPVGSSLGGATGLGQAITFGYRDRVIPYSHQFSLSSQHSLPGGFVLEASYSGNLTRRYPVTAQLNVIPASELGQPDEYYRQTVPNPMAGLLPVNPSKNGALIPRQDLLVPFPQYTNVTMTNVPLGRNSYHGMQLQLSRRFAAGFSLSAAYTISKTLEQMTFLNPQDFRASDIDSSKLEKRLAQFDAPQKLSLLTTYELPFAKSWVRSHGVLRKLVEGWQLNGHLTLQSGFPVDYPNAPQSRSGSARISDPTVYRAFDTSLFPRTAPNLQYALRTFPTRFSDVRLMPLQNLDVSLTKKTRLNERLMLELRVEMLNATNHPWFSRINDRGTDVTRPEFGWFQLEEQNQNRFVALVGKLHW